MATAGKSTSLKRSKPNYIYSIVGVSLVLLMMGIMGWFFLNAQGISKSLKEDIKINVYLRTLNKDTIGQIQQFIASKPYARDVKYIDKEEAKKIWNSENNEDWAKFLDFNPLPESIDFGAKSEYVNKDSIEKITAEISSAFSNQITDIKYPPVIISNIDKKAKQWGLIFLIIGIVLSIIVIFSIDNTIRLAMFSNRFLIKTMQMVGATRDFISRPMTIRAVINGFISAAITIVLLVVLIGWAESIEPELRKIRDIKLNLILFGSLLLLGVVISWFSTYRSVLKYLKMKLDDLY
jgi:cell division transport system permease protein